jgi:uncharacterized protein (TIGR00251 family)
VLRTAFTEVGDGIEFCVHLTPGAKREAIQELVVENKCAQLPIGEGSGHSRPEPSAMFRVSVHAKPTNNQANIALIKLISEQFKVAKSNISIVSGEKSRTKRIRICRYGLGDIPENVKLILEQAAPR